MSAPQPDVIGDVAARYANHGFSVFPCHSIEDGHCDCGKPNCTSPGKHPIASIVPHGVLDALADAGSAVQFWSLWPDANIGLATGDASGIVVVDVDVAGLSTIENLQRLHGELDPTWAVETGSGGYHFYYRMPEFDVRNSASAIGPGIDVRGTGGYVIAPPSNHISGRRYEWADEWHPRKVKLAHVPDWLLKRMVPTGTRQRVNPIPKVLTEGTRNNWLTNAAGSMRRKGFSQAAIAAALRIENRDRCKPPLDDREVEKIAWSVARYDPDDRMAASA